MTTPPLKFLDQVEKKHQKREEVNIAHYKKNDNWNKKVDVFANILYSCRLLVQSGGSLCVYMACLRKTNTNRNSTIHNQAFPDITVNLEVLILNTLRYIGKHTKTLIYNYMTMTHANGDSLQFSRHILSLG